MQGRWFCVGDLLRPQVLLDRQRVVGAALDRCVVRDDHALGVRRSCRCRSRSRRRAPAPSYSSQAASVFSSRKAESGIEQPLDPLPGEQLAARPVSFDGLGSPARRPRPRRAPQLRDELLHARTVRRELGRVPVDPRFEDRHYSSGGSLASTCLIALRTSASSWPKSSRYEWSAERTSRSSSSVSSIVYTAVA